MRLGTIGVILASAGGTLTAQAPASRPPGIFVEMPGGRGGDTLVKPEFPMVEQGRQTGALPPGGQL